MHSGWEQAQQPGFGPQYNGQLQAGQSQQHAFAQGQQHASSHQGGGVHASAVGGFAGDQGAWQGYQQPLQQQNGGYYQPPNQQVQQGGYQPVASTSAPVGGRQEQGGYTAGQQYGGVAQGMQYGVQSTHLRAMPQYPPQQPDSSGYAHFAQPPPAPLAQHPGPAPSPAPIQPQQHPTHHPPPPASAAYGTNFLQHSMQSFVPSSATMLSLTAQRFQSNPSPEHTQPHPPNPFPQQQQQQRPPPPPSSSHPPQQPPTPAQHLSPSAPTAAGLQNHLARFESITQHRQRLQQLDAQRNAVIGAGGGAEQVAQVERQMREVKTRELTLLSECETFVRQHGGAGAIQRYLEQMRANQQRFQQQQQQQFSQQTMPAQPAYSAQGYPQVLPNGGVQQGYSNAPQQPIDAQQQYPAAAPPPPRPAPSPRPQPPHQLHPQQQLGAVPSSSFNLQQLQQYPPAVADQQNASVDRSQLHPIPFPPPSSQDPTFQPPMRVPSVTMHPPSSSQPFQPGLPPQSQPPNPVNSSFPSLPHAPLPPRQAPMTASSAFPSDPRAQSAAQRVLPVSRAQVGQEPLPAPDGPMSNLVTREEWERMEKEREEREKKEGNPFGFPQGAGVAEKARRGKVRHPTQVLAEEVEGQPTLAELLAKVTPQKFDDVLKPLLAKHGQTLTPESHTLEERPIDLFQLSQVVIGQGGGYVKVDADNAWPRVASLLRSPPPPAGSFATPPAPPPTHLPTHLRDLYMRLLARYEDGWSGTMLKQREKEISLKGARELLLAKGKDAQAMQNGQAEGPHVGPTVQMGEPYKTPTMQIQHLQIVPSSPVSVNGTFGVSSAPLAPLSASPSALVSSPPAALPASSMSSMFANSFSAFSLAPTDIGISPSVTSFPTGTITSTDSSILAPSSPGKSNLLRPTTPHNSQQRVISPGTPRSSAAAAGQVAPFSTAAGAASPAQPRTSTPRPVLLAREASGGSSSLIGSPNAAEGEKGCSRATSVASSSRKRDRTREIGDGVEVVGDEGRRKREGTGAVLTPEAGSSGPTRQNSTSTDGGSSGISGKLGMTPSRPAGGFVSSPAAMALSDGTPDLVANKALRPDTATTVSSTSASPHSVGGGEIPLPTAPLPLPTSMQTVTPSTPVNSGLALSAASLSLSTPVQPSTSTAPVKSPPEFDFLSLTSPALGGLEASPMLFNTASWSTNPSAFDSFTSSTEADSFGLTNTGDIFVGLGGDDAATNGARSKQQLHPGADDDPWATSSLLDFEFVADSFTSS